MSQPCEGLSSYVSRDKLNRAFNVGCDARLRGRLPTAIPYRRYSILAFYWGRGWEDVHRHWGEASRVPVRPLPAIEQGTTVAVKDG